MQDSEEVGMLDKNRIIEVDALRGVAIILMVIYHFLFDLNYFGLVNIAIMCMPLVIFQRIIGVIFVGLVGVSIILSEKNNKFGYKTHFWHGLKILNFAILITAATWLYPHEGFVTFGVLHMIALSIFIAPFFFRFSKKQNLLIGIIIIIVGIWLNLQSTDLKLIFWLGLPYPEYAALDFYPMMPWFGVVLIGMAIGEALYPKAKSLIGFKSEKLEKLAYLGKRSLAIYLIHQIILIGLIMAYILTRST
jgi:uncharacterized membrane protein